MSEMKKSEKVIGIDRQNIAGKPNIHLGEIIWNERAITDRLELALAVGFLAYAARPMIECGCRCKGHHWAADQ